MQMSLFPMKAQKVFGGSLLAGKRKSARPLSTKHPIHLVLHSKIVLQAGGFTKQEGYVVQVLGRAARKWGLNIYEYAVNRDHIHLAIRTPSREAYRHFIQSVTGTIALAMNPSPMKCAFWDVRPFTRIVEWGAGVQKAEKVY